MAQFNFSREMIKDTKKSHPSEFSFKHLYTAADTDSIGVSTRHSPNLVKVPKIPGAPSDHSQPPHLIDTFAGS